MNPADDYWDWKFATGMPVLFEAWAMPARAWLWYLGNVAAFWEQWYGMAHPNVGHAEAWGSLWSSPRAPLNR